MIAGHCARFDSSQFLLPFQGSVLQNKDHVACEYAHTVLYWSLAHNCRENQKDYIILLATQAQCAELLKWPTYMRRTAGYTWTDYKTNAQITKELKITPILDKLLENKRNWMQHVNRLPRVMKYYSATGRRNYGRPLKFLLDTWDWNGSTSGLTPW